MNYAGLTTSDQQRIETVVRQYETVCTAADAQFQPELIKDLLPKPHDTLRLHVLTRLIATDMRLRSRRGDRVSLDEYLSSFEELRHASDSMPVLMHTEWELRKDCGDAPAIDEYLTRYPTHFEAFRTKCERQENDTASPPSEQTRDTSKPPPAVDATMEATMGVEKTMHAGKMATQPPPADSPPMAAPPEVPSAAPPDKPPGQSQTFVPEMNRYELMQPIGKGQFGEVWRAVAPGGVEVAVKKVAFPSAHRMSQMELRALEVVKKVRHPFVIQVHAYWPMEDQIIVVMELADGSLEHLDKQLKSEGADGIPIEELVEYVVESAEALDYLHGEKIVHRDIKPANILVAKGHAKVGDFGVARLFEADKPDIRATLVGTPQFMAHEVWENKVGPASDQYSLAATYLDLRVGLPEASLADLMTGKGGLVESANKLPDAERDVLIKATQRDPKARYPDCKTMAAALKQATSPEPVIPGVKWWLWLTAAVLLIACTLVIWFSIPPDPTLPIGFAEVFAPVEGSTSHAIHGFRYYDRVVFRGVETADGQTIELPLEFVLIPVTRPLDDPHPFYVSVDMITNEAFGVFARQNPTLVGDAWGEYTVADGTGVIRPMEHPKLPVMKLTIPEAHAFAQWIHPDARFPTKKEWLKAAGYFDCHAGGPSPQANGGIDCSDYPDGPFRGSWPKSIDAPRPDVAVGFGRMGLSRPRPVGTAKLDISPFGVRDMSGNGYELIYEWTGMDRDSTIPLKNPDPLRTSFELMSMKWDAVEPFLFDARQSRTNMSYLTYAELADGQERPLNRDRETGFRIVIPIPSQVVEQ